MVRQAHRLLACLAALATAFPGPISAGGNAPRRPRCAGRYATTLEAMTPEARARVSRPDAEGVHCLRATAVYEEISYGRGGRVRRRYHRKTRHGTGFAYRAGGEGWLVATNAHVVGFPDLTGDGSPGAAGAAAPAVEGVPPGARLVRVEVRVVGSESDPDPAPGPALAVLAVDEALDLAVLSSPRALSVLPWKPGRSASLRVGDAVLARGYPLGAFPAANAGRVIAVQQRDRDRGWDHEDFAVDALLNLGSSGSPVLAVSCETGEPELVGVYHAGYKGAQALNVVVAIDQLRGLLDDPAPAGRAAARARLAAPPEPPMDPAVLRAVLARGPIEFPFGGRVARAARDGDGIRWQILGEGFPLDAGVEAELVDAGGSGGPGLALREALRLQLGLVLAWRGGAAGGASSQPAPPARARLLSRIRALEEEQQDLVAAIGAGAPLIADGERRASARRDSERDNSPHAEAPETMQEIPER